MLYWTANNRRPTKTPFEAYFRHKPDVLNLRVFGSTAWARIPLDKRRALQPQSIECLFIGYPDESKGFKLLDIKIKQIIIERSVKFDEPLQEVELVKEKLLNFLPMLLNIWMMKLGVMNLIWIL